MTASWNGLCGYDSEVERAVWRGDKNEIRRIYDARIRTEPSDQAVRILRFFEPTGISISDSLLSGSNMEVADVVIYLMMRTRSTKEIGTALAITVPTLTTVMKYAGWQFICVPALSIYADRMAEERARDHGAHEYRSSNGDIIHLGGRGDGGHDHGGGKAHDEKVDLDFSDTPMEFNAVDGHVVD